MTPIENYVRSLEIKFLRLQRDFERLRSISGAGGSSYVQTTRQIISGDGLQGGGNLSQDRTLSIKLHTPSSGLLIDQTTKGLYVDTTGIVNVTAGSGLYATSGKINVGQGDGIQVDPTSVRVATTIAGTGLVWNQNVTPQRIDLAQTIAGQGLFWNTTVSPQRIDVGQGTLISVAENSIGLSSGAVSQYISTTSSSTTPAWRNLSALAGQGIDYNTNNDRFDIGAGTLISVDANAIRISDGAASQYISTLTDSNTPAWRNLSALAGLGLGYDSPSDSFFVNAGNGLAISEDNVVLGEPSTLTVSTTNLVTSTSHTHQITSSSNVISTTSEVLLKSTNVGKLSLKNLDVDTLIRTDSNNYSVGINVAPTGAAALDIRSGAIDDHSIRIRQISGQTGRLWRVENTAGSELIVLDSQGNLQSGNPGFVSGLTGWQITSTGNAEFNNGKFRGELRASVFAIEQIHASPGTLLVTRSAGKLLNNFTIVNSAVESVLQVRTTAFTDQNVLNYRSTSGIGSGENISARSIRNLMDIEDPEVGHAQLFKPGEILQIKAITGVIPNITGVASVWLKVNSAVDNITHFSYYVQGMSGTAATFVAGTAVVAHGLPGDGGVKISADGPYTPNLDVYTIGQSPWSTDIYPHVRLGRLDGVGVTGTSGIVQYGIILGENLANTNTPHMIASNLGVRMQNIDSTWNDGNNDTVKIESNGRARFGSNIYNTANTFLDINPATAIATFRGTIIATAGEIGGWSILSDSLTSNNIRLYSGAIGDSRLEVGTGTTTATSGITSASLGTDITFWAGSTAANRSTAPFRVTAGGAITATSGSIGGWTIQSGSLTSTNIGMYSGAVNTSRFEVGTGATSAGIASASAGGNITFWAGSSYADRGLSTTPFRVNASGSLFAFNATIRGTITAESGSFTGNVNIASSGSLTWGGVGTIDSSGIRIVANATTFNDLNSYALTTLTGTVYSAFRGVSPALTTAAQTAQLSISPVPSNRTGPVHLSISAAGNSTSNGSLFLGASGAFSETVSLDLLGQTGKIVAENNFDIVNQTTNSRRTLQIRGTVSSTNFSSPNASILFSYQDIPVENQPIYEAARIDSYWNNTTGSNNRSGRINFSIARTQTAMQQILRLQMDASTSSNTQLVTIIRNSAGDVALSSPNYQVNGVNGSIFIPVYVRPSAPTRSGSGTGSAWLVPPSSPIIGINLNQTVYTFTASGIPVDGNGNPIYKPKHALVKLIGRWSGGGLNNRKADIRDVALENVYGTYYATTSILNGITCIVPLDFNYRFQVVLHQPGTGGTTDFYDYDLVIMGYFA